MGLLRIYISSSLYQTTRYHYPLPPSQGPRLITFLCIRLHERFLMASISGTWKVLWMIWRSWIRTLARLNLGRVVLLRLLMAQWLRRASQGQERSCPWSGGHGFEPGQVKLGVDSTSVWVNLEPKILFIKHLCMRLLLVGGNEHW